MTISGEVNVRQSVSGDLQMPRIVSGGSITVDSALSSTSENPVQNNVIKAALDGKIAAPADPVSGQFLVYNGTAWVAQTLTAWQGGSY